VYKQAIVVRTDLKMGKGKVIAQCCHASLGCIEEVSPRVVKLWKEEGAKKVILQVKNLRKLRAIYRKALAARLPCFLVKNRGKTQLRPGTTTCVAIGPAKEVEVDKVTGKLKLL